MVTEEKNDPIYCNVVLRVEECVWIRRTLLLSALLERFFLTKPECVLPQDLTERLHRLHVERESLESKMEAEKHVMRAQLRDMMEKQRAETQRLSEQHQAQVSQTQQELLGQLEEWRRTSAQPPAQEACGGYGTAVGGAPVQRMAELEGWCWSGLSPSQRDGCDL